MFSLMDDNSLWPT